MAIDYTVLEDSDVRSGCHIGSTQTKMLPRNFLVEREDRKRAKRFHLVGPPVVHASEAYAELLGMSAKLAARVSKSTFRSALRNASQSKSDIESAAREVWLTELIGYMEEGELPIVRIASATSEPLTVLKRAFGNGRMKVLRNRARGWRKVREWLLAFKSHAFPRDASDMLDYLLFLMQEGVSASRIDATCASLAVLEDCGQVPSDVKISLTGVDWLKIGFAQWAGYGHLDRGYFVFTSNQKFTQPIFKYANTD